MANSGGVWGIDIGQCALKALRCTSGPGDTVIAEAFDYIEYPKILNQPEADPKAMIQDAIAQFLSRNKVKGDKVAISVSGQSGLARFFKPPPVDAKKMPDLVKFEARQQIPFALEDVIWDWQTLGGGTEVDGFALDTEVGLFAMKRDAVFRALEPFDQAEIEVDIVQLTPEAVYNFVAHDIITDGPTNDAYDSENPPPSLAVLSMGTDTTDLVVTNGFRLWQRSIPIGGNHFTKQLSKELKLTFAKAEHLKRNARQAEDPKAIFQAMRSTFNDMVNEVQRSLAYFQGVDRKAKIKSLVLLGNAVKLPGLTQYLSKNLGIDVINFDTFTRLTGAGVVASPSFKDNMLSFSVCYGLCLQGLGQSKLRTNLVPRELIVERMIRAKKPWALASYAGLLLACSFNFFFHFNAWSQVHPDKWAPVISQVDGIKAKSAGYDTEFKKREDDLKRLTNVGEELVGNVDRRLLWLELLKAITDSLPRTPGLAPGVVPDHKDFPIDKRQEIHIEYIETEYFPDLTTWWAEPEVKRRYAEERRIAADAAAALAPAAPPAVVPGAPVPPGTVPPAATAPPVAGQTPPATGTPTDATVATVPEAEDPGPVKADATEAEKSGWVVEIQGYHYYNKNPASAGPAHVRSTLIRNLEEGTVDLPVSFGNQAQTQKFTMKELGIGYVILAADKEFDRYNRIPNADYRDPNETTGGPGDNFLAPMKTEKKDPLADKDNVKEWTVPKYTFVIQFVWKEKLLRKRLQEREQRLLEAQRAAEEAATAAANGTTVPGT
ncbi:MAG TPA: pilus assembly protein PilM [Pirellulaceae bacterium]|nr:pilus assembly protein PilM [Pirellulaceae bacterium]